MIKVAFTGHKQHGKTSCAEFTGANCFSFSEPMAHGIYKGLLDQGFRVKREDFFGKNRHPAVLRIYQILGTDLIRDRDIEGHVRIMERRVTACAHLCIAVENVRFQNEAAMLRRHGFAIVRVVRPGHNADDGRDSHHISEVEQDEIDVDYIIVNDGSLNDLAMKVCTMLKEVI